MSRILIPVDEDQGRDSIPNTKFGSSPLYLLVDSQNPENDMVVQNQSSKFGGDLKPILFVLDQEPDTVFTTHACDNAIKHLDKAGITPYLVQRQPVHQILDQYEKNNLSVMTEGTH